MRWTVGKSLRSIAACHADALAKLEASVLGDIRASDPVLFDRAHAYGLLEGRVRTALAQLKLGNPMAAQATLARALGETL
jgi:hypothetical protein